MPKKPNLSKADEEILRLFRDGDHNPATELLIAHYGSYIVSIPRWPRWNFDAMTQEELASEITAAVAKALPTFTTNAKLKTFINGVGHKKCVSRIREWARKGAHLILIDDYSEEESDRLSATPADDAFNPWKLVVDNERAGLVHQLLGMIGEKCRNILKMRFIRDMSYREISEELDTTTNEIGKRIYYCKEEAFGMAKKMRLQEE
jgi:RNA polymerase sigma factor (sigma-70 family)